MTLVLKVAQKHKQMESLFQTEICSRERKLSPQRHREAQQHDTGRLMSVLQTCKIRLVRDAPGFLLAQLTSVDVTGMSAMERMSSPNSDF